MIYKVVFSPEAEEQLLELYRFIAGKTSAVIATRNSEAIVDYCEGLKDFPFRHPRRDDIRVGLHITNYKKRVVIAYGVDEDTVSILGIFYGGQDFESFLADED